MYHRVAEQDMDPWSLAVTPEHFGEQLAVIQKYAQPLSLMQLEQARQANTIPPRAVAITFDDGYANNLFKAKPLLERFDIPATVFVASGYSTRSREFWWDELDQALLQPGPLPEKLCLDVDGAAREWELGAAASYSEAEYRRDLERYEGLPGSRLALYYSIWSVLQRLEPTRQQLALDTILAWSQKQLVARPTHRPMTPAELGVLEAGGLVSVGGHTVTHPLLMAHSPLVQRDEIRRGKADLETILGHEVASFSYPFGAYTNDTIAIVRDAGFACACSTVAETIWRRSEPFQLPRFGVCNWNGAEFEQRLWQYFGN